MRCLLPLTVSIATAVLGAGGASTPAAAHPHIWVISKVEVVYEKEQIAAIQHHWTFDEFYTAQETMNLDTNNDKVFSREELAGLAKVNMEGLKDFDFFTAAQVGKQVVGFDAPIDPWLEHKNGVLTLHFKLPLKTPVKAAEKGFKFAVYDPSSFIAFELDKGDAITLTGAPQGCRIDIGELSPSSDQKSLTGAMTEQLGSAVLGVPTIPSAAVICGNS